MRKRKRGLRILMVEHNPADVYLLRDALKEIGGTASVWALRDAETAVDWINQCGDSEWQNLRPDLILLDLDLPGMSGNELLLLVKSNARTRSVPVIAMSTCSTPEVVRQAYDGHASCFVRKPGDLDGFIQAVTSMQSFWTHTAKLPGRSTASRRS